MSSEFEYFDLDEALDDNEWECEEDEEEVWWLWRWVFALGAFSLTVGFFYLIEWHKQRGRPIAEAEPETAKEEVKKVQHEAKPVAAPQPAPIIATKALVKTVAPELPDFEQLARENIERLRREIDITSSKPAAKLDLQATRLSSRQDNQELQTKPPGVPTGDSGVTVLRLKRSAPVSSEDASFDDDDLASHDALQHEGQQISDSYRAEAQSSATARDAKQPTQPPPMSAALPPKPPKFEPSVSFPEPEVEETRYPPSGPLIFPRLSDTSSQDSDTASPPITEQRGLTDLTDALLVAHSSPDSLIISTDSGILAGSASPQDPVQRSPAGRMQNSIDSALAVGMGISSTDPLAVTITDDIPEPLQPSPAQRLISVHSENVVPEDAVIVSPQRIAGSAGLQTVDHGPYEPNGPFDAATDALLGEYHRQRPVGMMRQTNNESLGSMNNGRIQRTQGLPKHLHSEGSLESGSIDSLQREDRPLNGPQKEDSTSAKSTDRSSILELMDAADAKEAIAKVETLAEVSAVMREAGLESSNLIFGIDYTASNKYQGEYSFNGRSLHSINPEVQNPYQQVISIMGRTLHPFATSGFIPVFGFGDVKTSDFSVFALKEKGYCRTFDEVLRVYNKVTPKVILSGPTNFAPLIYQSIDICKQIRDYHILVIVADGQVTNERATRRAIVDACKYPLSIIVVGVGDGPWEMMRVFDDSLPKRPWDNFHFVEFNQLIAQEDKPDVSFAVESLLEIPDQYKQIKALGLLPLDGDGDLWRNK